MSNMTLVEKYASRREEVEATRIPANLAAALDEAADRFGDQTLAVFFDAGESFTFEGLRTSVREMSAVLAGLGIGPGTKVAVLLQNRPEFPITWLALARLGAVMVPANTSLKTEEIAFLVGDAEATHLVGDVTFLDKLDLEQIGIPEENRVIFGGDPGAERSFETLRSGNLPIPEPAEVGLDDLVSIQYTSGTTGLPKGALLTHRYWLTSAVVMLESFDEPPARILSDTPFFYLDPQFEFLMVMLGGRELFVADRPSLSKFMDRIRDHRIDYCAFWENALTLPISEKDSDHSLRWTSTTGLPGNRQRELEDRFQVVSRELYGMTEVGAALMMPWDDDSKVGSGSCGIPMPFREAKIVNPDGLELGPGEVGELLLRGPGLFLGYNKRPDVNKELITDDGWFHTGDLMKRDEDGCYYFIGRMKDMIRRSHENISAVEVEAALEHHEAVSRAAVVPVPDDFRGEEVKAIVLVDEAAFEAPSPEELISFVADRLAKFKVPRYVEFRDELPMTASGKVAKAALKAEKDPLANVYDRESAA